MRVRVWYGLIGMAWLALVACRNEAPRAPLPASLPALPSSGPSQPLRWLARAQLPGAHRQACDLASHAGRLLVAASTSALEENGAGLYRLSGDRVESLLTWSGQGFLRVHPYGERVYVPDADAPFGAGFFFRLDVDGYVFSIDPRHPERYARETIPAVYHVFDTALLDGTLYASSGAYVPGDIPYRAPRAPAALFAQGEPGEPWRRVLALPEAPEGQETGVVRFTYLHPLGGGSLLAGFTDWSGLSGGDGAMLIEGLPDAPRATRAEGVPGPVLRWSQWKERIYAVVGLGSQTALFVSTDGGRHFAAALQGANDPRQAQALVPTESALYLLADGALYRSEDGERWSPLGEAHPALVHTSSPLVTAPLVLHDGALWAASPSTGQLFEAVPAH